MEVVTNTLLGFAGISIVLLFVLCAGYLITSKKPMWSERYTMSSIASTGRYISVVRILCWCVSILIVPYTFGLSFAFNLDSISLTMVLGIFATLSLFITALTINKPQGLIHRSSALVFFMALLAMPLEIAFKLSVTKYNWVSYSVLIVLFSSLIYTYIRFIVRHRKLNGVSELILMGLNSLWVVLYSLIMIM